MLLRIAPGPKLVDLDGTPVNLRQCIEYFIPNHPEINSFWPANGKATMDSLAPYGCRAFHKRMGPFLAACKDPDNPACGETLWADIGGGYNADGSLNQKFFDANDQDIAYAESKGWYVEVVVVDTWGCKYSDEGNLYNPWKTLSPPALKACGRTAGDPVEEAWIRKVVSSFTKHSNVIWLQDNEGGLIPDANQAWWDWEWKIIRDEEQKSGENPVKVHLIGADPGFIGNADYTYTHVDGGVAPTRGYWTTNNEHNGIFPAGLQASYFIAAEKAGLSWAFWQGDQDDAQSIAALEAIKTAIGGTAQCWTPDGEDPYWNQTPESQADSIDPTVTQGIRNAVFAAESSIGNRCGTPCPDSLELLASTLRAQNYCASKNNDAVFTVANPQQKKFFEMHACSYGNGCWTTQTAVNPKNT